MCGINIIKNEHGGVLLNTLIFILFLGMMGMSLLTLVSADARMQRLNMGERRAFYAAQSGIEYAMLSINKFAVNNSNMYSLNNYTEDLETGDGTHCIININIVRKDSLRIQATGYSQNYAKTLEKDIKYIDVSYYAVYTSGTAQFIRTIPPKRILQNAKYMPFFDLDELRNLARPRQYFLGNITIGKFIFFRNFVFAEGNLTFSRFNWGNTGNFVTMGDMLIQQNLLSFNNTRGTFYLPTRGSNFACGWQSLGGELKGGMISNGNIVGTNRKFLPFRFTVRYDRSSINNLLQHTVNGGPLVFTNSWWSNL